MLLEKEEKLNNLEMEIHLFNRTGIYTSILRNFSVKLVIRSKWLLLPLTCHMAVTISVHNHKTECPTTKKKRCVQPSYQKHDNAQLSERKEHSCLP